ncbi:glutamine amidotransferase [Cryobacterium sp. TMT1-21]|uniref:glutamine amidotransferase n=1 Tax=unclassified Cryobacterium TaxID=2649013 RepID=UPI00106A6AB9|nr:MULTISPECIES: glutamine amidotransferase [unclassified Cryobacterium]TFC87917.1 glutamine amidotransferase [Cryobacterium sp. TmT2-59]TFD16490.1 glutamine amidotransferase [Cryobacterium sp. TMT1-21]TFD16938.1 glutamine amidotransferase [Cryobacterium sp. TMT4-10]TFD37494.1 glutamine amidotransferase [Cryobacterium sp. TMT2-10]
MTRTAVVLRHDATIHLGNLEPVLLEYGYTVRYVDTLTEDVRAIDPEAADLLVVLGGEMGVYEADRFPALHDEVELLRQRLTAARPVFGVCLGAQLMANALGSRVYRGPTNEIGYRAVEPTTAGADSPVRHVAGVPVFQWHSDTFDLPDTVTRLAGSPQYGNEAFAIGNWALAVQFHPEVTDEMHEVWLIASEAEVAAEGFDPAALRRDRERYSSGMQRASRAMFSEWLGGLDPQRSP